MHDIIVVLGGSWVPLVLAIKLVVVGGGIELLNAYKNMHKDQEYFIYQVSKFSNLSLTNNVYFAVL